MKNAEEPKPRCLKCQSLLRQVSLGKAMPREFECPVCERIFILDKENLLIEAEDRTRADDSGNDNLEPGNDELPGLFDDNFFSEF